MFYLGQLGRLGWTVCYPLRERNEGNFRVWREREEKQLNNQTPDPCNLDLGPFTVTFKCCAVLCEVQCSVASTLDVILRVG